MEKLGILQTYLTPKKANSALEAALSLSSSGLRAQDERFRILAENLANGSNMATEPGAEPYKRKIAVFDTQFDKETGADLAVIRKIVRDNAPFQKIHMPGHPAADKEGFVLKTNVNPTQELYDFMEANHSRTANLEMLKKTFEMYNQIIELMTSSD